MCKKVQPWVKFSPKLWMLLIINNLFPDNLLDKVTGHEIIASICKVAHQRLSCVLAVQALCSEKNVC